MIKKIIIGGIGALALIFIILISFYLINLSPIKGEKLINFTINNGDSATKVIKRLKEEDLIKNELVTKIYCYLNNKTSFQAGVYELNQNMDVNTIVTKFNSGDVLKDTFNITLVEGKRLIDYIEVISSSLSINNNMNDDIKNIIDSSKTNKSKLTSNNNIFNEEVNNYIKDMSTATSIKEELQIINSSYKVYKEELTNLLKDKNYLQELINNYWFIDESILNTSIYYPLEGYLYPSTYEFKKGATPKDVINKLISTLNGVVSKYKEDIEKSKYSFHELLALASMIEAEAATKEDRALVSGVFYNRLNDGWTLGSDVTAYYGVGKTFTDIIYQEDLDKCNPYNTRGTCVKGLPIGAINSPSLDSIYAAIFPTSSDYYFFVADKNKKVYFSKTSAEQATVISSLKAQGLWL